jgi:hypothetical protein
VTAALLSTFVVLSSLCKKKELAHETHNDHISFGVRAVGAAMAALGNGAETIIYPEGNITLLDAHLFDPAQLAQNLIPY